MKAIAVVGPTAGGKTALSLSLATAIGGEILCCDSMQVYRRMDIGTAKPTAAERAVCPHHLFDIADPAKPFSAAEYAACAMQTLREVTARGAVPVFCGGTGLYLDAVRTLRHMGGAPQGDPALRERLTAEAQTPAGREALFARLQAVDPDAAAATHPNNVRRVVRALEIYELTGQTKTSFDQAAATLNPELELLIFGIFYTDRSLLYARIDARVEQMLAAGLLEETRTLAAEGLFTANGTAAQAIGYKELLAALDGTATVEAATERLKTATRRYAKRQMTYFRAMPGVHWISADREGVLRTPQALTEEILPSVRAFLDGEHIAG